jgi:hypothetical protein
MSSRRRRRRRNPDAFRTLSILIGVGVVAVGAYWYWARPHAWSSGKPLTAADRDWAMNPVNTDGSARLPWDEDPRP